MDRRIVAAGLVAAFALPAFAQAPSVSPIPANPVPAETQPSPGTAGREDERTRRLQQGGSPADAATQRRQGQAAPEARPGQQ